MTDLERLAELARAHVNGTAVIRPDRWMDAATPQTILALCAEVERMRAVVEAARATASEANCRCGKPTPRKHFTDCPLAYIGSDLVSALAALDAVEEK